MASKGSFFSVSGAQQNLQRYRITAGGTFAATGPGLYLVKRSPSSNLTFDLPPAASAFTFVVVLYIKDIGGDADKYPITIVDPAGLLIDGQPSLVLNTPYAAATLAWNGSDGWNQIA